MYKFNQFRRNQYSSYLTPLTYNLTTIQQKSSLSEAVVFNETVMNLSGNSILHNVDDTGVKKRNYFIRFKIYKKENSTQTISVVLESQDENDSRTQTLETIVVAPGLESYYDVFDIVIPPNAAYDRIHFKLERELIDYNQLNEDGTYGRTVQAQVMRFDEINNIVTHLDSAIENKGRFKQIGVQSAPGLQMCIDGEQIRVGRSGIYEINNGVNVQFLGFIVEPDDGKYFLLDYQY